MGTRFLDRRLFFVVGKGGVGKSTVAALLAVALAEGGRRVLLAQVEPGRRLPGMFGLDGELESPTEALPGLTLLTIEGEASLSEYLSIVLPVKRVHRLVVTSKLYHHFVAAAPGLRELMSVGKLWYEEQLVIGGRPRWDAIVVDAPATGHSLQYLRMPQAAATAFGPGLVRREALRVTELLRDETRTVVCPVTTAEEMPVNETIEMYAQLRGELAMPLGTLFVNRMHTAPVTPDLVGTPPARAPAQAPALVGDVLRCAREEAGWASINARYLARLHDAIDMPIVELPFLFAEEFGLSEVRVLLAGVVARLEAA